MIVNSDGSFEYTPDDDHTGKDTFEFRVDDGNGDSDVKKADITTEETDENLTGTAIAETIYGLGGNDTINGKEDNDTLYGDSPTDPTITGLDQLHGNDGDDSLIAGPGNDTLWGDGGADTMNGGQGDDLFHFAAGGSDAASGEQIDGGTDNDSLYLDNYNSSLDFTAASSIMNMETLNFAASYVTAKLTGSLLDGKSWLVDGHSAYVNLDVQADGSAFDLSNMTFTSWASSDDINLYGTANNDTITGTVLADSITGSEGVDSLFGGKGDDTINGDSGNDWLEGEKGVDSLTGGDGRDTFVLSDKTAIDTVNDFEVLNSGESGDIIRFEESDLGLNAQGNNEFLLADNIENQKDPTIAQIIGVTNTAASNWSDAADVMGNTLNKFGNGTNDDTYFVLSNGSDSRIYYWDGDMDGGSDIDESELTHLADLSGITETDIGDMDEGINSTDFDVI